MMGLSRWWSSKAPKDEESNNKIKNLQGITTEEINLSLIDLCGGNLCFDEPGGGDFCFDDFDIDSFMGYLDFDQENNNNIIDSHVGEKSRTSNSESLFSCDIDIHWLMGYLDMDQENSKEMNLEESRTLTAESFLGDCSAADQCQIGDLCSDDFDINWFMRCLDSDNTINKVVRRKIKIGDQELVEFGCVDDLGCEDLCLDEFMGYLDSDKENNNMIESDVGNNLEESRASNLFIGVADFSVADQCEIGGGFCLDDLLGGDLCFDEESNFDIDWFMRCLDSDQKEDPVEANTVDKLEKRGYEAEFGGDDCFDDLGGFDIDWFMRILDSNQEDHRTSSNLGKRKFHTEGKSNQTKRTCL